MRWRPQTDVAPGAARQWIVPGQVLGELAGRLDTDERKFPVSFAHAWSERDTPRHLPVEPQPILWRRGGHRDLAGRGHHPAVVNEHPGIKREVSVSRHSQTVNIFSLVQRLDGNDFVVVSVPLTPVIVNAEAARQSFAARFADVLTVCDLG